MAGRTALLLAALLFPLFPDTAAPQDPRLEDQFGEEITVSLISMTVRAVDGRGRPITGLGPEDFRVRVGKKEVPVVGVDWFSSAEPAPPAPDAGEEAPAAEPRPVGKLVVFWVQADFEPTRVSGQLRLWPYVDEFLETLHPADRMAVISYDSHLHLRQDFTGDREAVHAAVYRGIRHGNSETGPGSGEVSLIDSFDLEDAAAAASPERALEVTAESLAALPGEKVIVYLGWGLGRFGSFGVQMTPAFYPAVRALRRANIPVFVLDVTSADYHSLEVGLEAVAHATGGTYQKTNVLTGLATDFLANAISGHYVITIDPGTVPARGGSVTVELRDRKRGSAITRPLTLR
jgi:VWFA-related protein